MATKAGNIDGDVKATPDTVETIVRDTTIETTQDAKEVTPPKAVEPESFEDAPDPEEDDLDDLDDMLDEFSPTKTESKPATTEAPKPEKSTAGAASDEMADLNGMSEEDFAKHLQADMANLLGGMNSNPELAAQFKEMMSKIATEGGEGPGDFGAHPDAAGAYQQSAKSAAPSTAEESFQDTIRKTMEKIQASGEQATAACKEEDTDDILAELMKQMQSSGLGGEGGEEDFSKMLLGMMEQLTNKDILYEPMKELHDKFPAWMEKNKAATSKEDLKRYEEQQKVVAEIVKKFEEPTYTDASPTDREYIVGLMQLMQAAGSPPSDLVGDMASAQEAFGAPPDEGCPQQ
ncbi:Peroxisome chaperone and import receptor [Pseudogymnoascus destructans]|uniref:Peroxisome chaperone and import receptor n=2 Tax=Pseudogymnoascus destructans TaxID=655981 RepID=L8FTP2_PSED2|nr:Peroxisome chaperone and import receptor [Pseudogymnoascus destructans]ELR04330.1 hypothetical protein GMDG_06712 [Pseudogymnoascus destructans 20631-21]OAF59801.1 Peroxisome chaperone and import receptor [Pseudogymnoascus destructans]